MCELKPNTPKSNYIPNSRCANSTFYHKRVGAPEPSTSSHRHSYGSSVIARDDAFSTPLDTIVGTTVPANFGGEHICISYIVYALFNYIISSIVLRVTEKAFGSNYFVQVCTASECVPVTHRGLTRDSPALKICRQGIACTRQYTSGMYTIQHTIWQ